MQLSKKAYTTFIITVLTISALMATIPMASAISNPPGLYVPASTPTTAKDSGFVGDKVLVVGNTTNGTASAFSTVTVYWDSLAGQVLGTTAANVNGEWAVNVTIPSAKNGAHYIVAKDDGSAQGAPFTVNASLKSSTDPSTAEMFAYDAKVLPGDPLTVVGHGYSPSSVITVAFVYNATYNETITTPSITTNATGSFQAVVTVPTIAPVDYGNWTVNATDASSVFATSDILIDYYITVVPPVGPPGITIMMMGRIPLEQGYTLLIDTTPIGSGTSGADGTFMATYETPALIGSGAHTIYVKWVVGINAYNRSATFTVGPAPSITLGASESVAGVVITVSGSSFSGFASIELYFDDTLVNSTADDNRFGPTSMGGSFTNLEFTVPALTPKVYTVTVVDAYGATATATFTIKAAPATTIALRGTTYYQGDTLSFNIVTTESNLGTITVTIMDPSDAVWWTTNAWTLSGTVIQSVYYQTQVANGNPLALPADAPTGTWNWTVTYTPASTGVSTKATGLFTVAVSGSGAVIAKIDELGANMTAILESIDGNVATIDTSLGTVETKLSSLDATISGLDGDIATIKTNLGTVQASVDDLDLVVGNMYGDVVTINTTLGTIEGTITDMDGTLATIETDLGTVKLDVAAVQTDVEESLPVAVDMMPVWIAVILSLIAAIAAIFAVVTIRQKIAG
jgi:hypothetical protein